MKLLSFAADGKELFGAVSGDGVVTLNKRIGQPDLRAALAAGTMEAMRKAAKEAKPDHKLARSNSCRRSRRPEKFCAPASITARMRPRPDANCRSSRACSSASPTRWSAMTAR